MTQSTTLALRDDARLEENLQRLMRAAALDEDYIATWPMKAWQQWSRLMDTPHGEPCPVTPEWMWTLTADRSIARTAPYPSLGLVFSSHDWFKENQLHPDLHLDVDAAPSPPMPGLIELHQAWQQATAWGLHPAVLLDLTPDVPWGSAVKACIGAIAVFDATPEQITQLTTHLGSDRLRAPAPAGFWESNAPTPDATITEWNWDFS